jgi:Type IV secretion system pilin
MDFIKKNWQKVVFTVYSLVVPIVSFAQGNVPAPACGPGKICNPIPKVGSLPDLIKTILEGVLKIGIPVIALAIIYSGFLFVFARGNPEKLTKAKDALLYTLIGAAILLGSWAIATMIQTTVTGLGS